MSGPAVARVLVPVGSIAACVGTNALAPGRSAGDLVAAAVPGTVGLLVFSRSVATVAAMCADEMSAADARSEVAYLHVGVAVIMAACLAGQLMGLRSALAQHVASQRAPRAR